MNKTRWIETSPAEKRGKHKCITATCSCGNKKIIRHDHYVSGRSKSCGCLRDEKSAERKKIHGENKTELHNVWQSMRSRTRCKTSTAWKDYGGRGIYICEQWNEFTKFKEWAVSTGYSSGLEIDRIDNDAGYSPENCRWVSRLENMRNTRTNRVVFAFGENKPLVGWTEDKRCVVSYATLWARLNRGWCPEQAITANLPSDHPYKTYAPRV